MARRKQEPIFTRVKKMEAGLPPEKQQVEDSLREIVPVNGRDPVQSVENNKIQQDQQERGSISPYSPDLDITISAGPAEPVLEGSPLRALSMPTPLPDLSTTGLGSELLPESSFVLIVPGIFLMGSPEYETGRSNDEIMHVVTLTTSFYVQKTPVTQGQWKAVMGDNPASFLDGGDYCPIEGISWDECQEFIRRLNAGKDGIYRLPTEAEWEYACRAGSLTPFCNGEISELYCARDPLLGEVGWYCGNSGRKSRPVGQKSPNAWGLFDMHGNVSEWCQDWYGEYGSDSETDPQGPKSGSAKVIRGGSWFGNAKNCRSASRFHWPPNSRSEFIGFRLVKEIS
jgi:formylglycine-generating enzyme required for sulfatase activity